MHALDDSQGGRGDVGHMDELTDTQLLTSLLQLQAWDRIAGMLEAGDVLPVRLTTREAALWLAKYLWPRGLRVDRRGSTWRVVADDTRAPSRGQA